MVMPVHWQWKILGAEIFRLFEVCQIWNSDKFPQIPQIWQFDRAVSCAWWEHTWLLDIVIVTRLSSPFPPCLSRRTHWSRERGEGGGGCHGELGVRPLSGHVVTISPVPEKILSGGVKINVYQLSLNHFSNPSHVSEQGYCGNNAFNQIATFFS